jgi:hypothetical protein
MTSEEEAPATVEQWADLDFEPIDSKTLARSIRDAVWSSGSVWAG